MKVLAIKDDYVYKVLHVDAELFDAVPQSMLDQCSQNTRLPNVKCLLGNVAEIIWLEPYTGITPETMDADYFKLIKQIP